MAITRHPVPLWSLRSVLRELCDSSATVVCSFFFFKQKTAYEMRISDWSSDVCSSDLLGHRLPTTLARILDRDGSRAPIVNVCEFTPSLGVSSAHIDNAGAAREVMEPLYAMGHRDIALVLGPPDSPLTRDRLVGAQRAAEIGRAHV